MGLFEKIKNGLKKTRDSLGGSLGALFSSSGKIDEEFYEELEEILVMADVGVSTAEYITETLRENVKEKGISNPEDTMDEIKQIVAKMLSGDDSLKLRTSPSVILVIGVNGVGKTTTIGKLACRIKATGKSVIIAAADTFRAAAIDQLAVWAERADVPMVRANEGADPAAVIFDTIQAAKARDCDIIICDTAGRLHNKKNLMDELNKIYRVIDRELPRSDKETLLVLDAATGQNAVNQAREFKNAAKITGIVLTKLDGTPKGGVVLPIKKELGLSVKFIGVGEQIDDLQPFNAEEFAQALFDTGNTAPEDEAGAFEANEEAAEAPESASDEESFAEGPEAAEEPEAEKAENESDDEEAPEEEKPAKRRFWWFGKKNDGGEEE